MVGREIIDVLAEYGFSEREVLAATDPRLVRLFCDLTKLPAEARKDSWLGYVELCRDHAKTSNAKEWWSAYIAAGMSQAGREAK